EGRPPFNEISILFPLLTLYTVGYMGLMAAEFFLRGALKMPSGLMPIYIALLGAYAADKEIRRWTGSAEPQRKGSLFVYLWALLYLAAFTFRTFRPEFMLPAEFGPVVLQVVGIFFGSRASKYIYANRRVPDGRQTTDDGGRQTEILEMIKAAGKVTNRDVAGRFAISDTSANRLLADMTAKGLIQRMGERKATYYIMP
ncbi:MAG: winged helix-turn-helix transcriptional regulator, partial [Candidatus Omnitrophica bacterium]|nr:winged helix-turn-helix transcriptional regulator [Candidatus Omnitrophota bacterium]